MQELVGRCKQCGKDIYCNDGFINGVVQEDQTLLCFDCSADHEDEEAP
ncbi:hypothetical protein [Paenibacillus spongiae]|uniref:GapA-binding peptide SR1P n=1 Tax=Paenibacillus spongiae TaxID=2909671 RepID=A0ABY5S5T7_9BACL|nr:hypothetical protein [Paenibacillus spongiae]UVI28940.1 hypothetical protein L1F29_26390 [Paenibacillus spongiae]